MLLDLFSKDNYIYLIEGLTVLAVLVYVGYVFYSLNLFKKG